MDKLEHTSELRTNFKCDLLTQQTTDFSFFEQFAINTDNVITEKNWFLLVIIIEIIQR